MRKIILVIVAVLTLGGILSSCSLPTASPPQPNAEDHQGPSFTIFMRNLGYPCEPPTWPQPDRDWQSSYAHHGCVFEYTWMYDLGWCYDRSGYSSELTGDGNCTGKDESYWFRWSIQDVQNNGTGAAFITWCLNHGGSCLPPNSPRRGAWTRSLEIDTMEEIVAEDLALVEAIPLPEYENPAVEVDDFTLDQKSQLYWDIGTIGALDAGEQEAVSLLGDTSDLTVWRDDHRPSVVPPGSATAACVDPTSLAYVLSTDRRPCWKYTWMWHAGWCGPGKQPFTTTTNFNNGKAAWCPNGTWPISITSQTAPLLQWDAALQWWKPTQAGQDWIDGKFQTGWLPVSPVGCSAC